MIRILLAAAVAALLPSCATAPPTGLSLAYNGHLGPVPYRVSYSGGKATVAISAPWRNLLPDRGK
jgi:hypothetical protein